MAHIDHLDGDPRNNDIENLQVISPRRFQMCGDPNCDAGGEHFHEDAWGRYRASLTPDQWQWLRDKAAWEHMSVSAVANEWGVTP